MCKNENNLYQNLRPQLIKVVNFNSSQWIRVLKNFRVLGERERERERERAERKKERERLEEVCYVRMIIGL